MSIDLMRGWLVVLFSIALMTVPTAAAQPSLLALPEQAHVTLAEDGGIWVQFAIVGAPAPPQEPLTVRYAIDGGAPETEAAQHVGVMTTRVGADEPVGTHIYAALVPVGPGQTVSYSAGSTVRGFTPTYEVTVPPANGTIRFVAMGDIGYDGVAADGSQTPGQESAPIAVRDLALEHEPDLVIIPGDLAYQNSQPGWDRFMRMYVPLQATVPTMPVAGNHEWEDGRGYSPFLNHYVLPNDEHDYVFRAGPVTFVGLNSDAICTGDTYRTNYGHEAEPCPYGEPDLKKIAWINQTLAAIAQEDPAWVVVFMHHPPYSHGRHGNDWGNQVLWVPIFEEHGVDLVVAAHDHLYSRSYPILSGEPTQTGSVYARGDGIVHVVTGGGGRALYEITDEPAPAWHAAGESIHHITVFDASADRINMTAYRLDGSVLDSFEIRADVEPGGAEPEPEAPAPGVAVVLVVLLAAFAALRRRR